jgi:demethylmenaquinone methyltransferase/2-methoxy-6-polyprenyl-1,4-benzoquinol methylase
MFDTVAQRYDLTNDLLSLGQDRRWRRVVAAAVAAGPGERVLDLAAGTGTSTLPFAHAGASAFACDFSLGMLRQGRRRHRQLRFVAGDGLRLPFRDQVFDAVTMSFGLRNVAHVPTALAELHRVCRPGGRLVICEFSRPRWPPLRRIYERYLLAALPVIARRVSSNPESYDYLAESIRAWPDQQALADTITAAGWVQVAWRDLSGGIVAVHRARRAAQPAD